MLLALLLLAASPDAAPAGRPQILLLDLTASDDVPTDKLQLLGGSFASALAKRGDVEAITAADLRAMTELEASKAAAGCDQDSCLAELAAALGARYVIYGRVGSLGPALLMQVNLFDAVAGKAVSREERSGGDLAALSAAIPAVVDALLVPLGAPAAAAPEPLGALAITGGALALAGGVVALGAGVGAGSLEAVVWAEGGDVAEKEQALQTAPWLWVGSLAGVAVAGAGVALLLLPGDT